MTRVLSFAYATVVCLLTFVASAQVPTGFWAPQSLTADQPRMTIETGQGTIRLPPGHWEELPQPETFIEGITGGTSNRSYTHKLYYQVTDGKLRGVIYITFNKSGVTDFRIPDWCGRKDTLLTGTTAREFRGYDCLVINHIPVESYSDEKGYLGDVYKAVGSSVTFPSVWLVADISFPGTTNQFTLNVNVFRNVAAEGFSDAPTTWAASLWHKDHVTADRKAVAQDFLAWAKIYHDQLLKDYRR